MTWLRRDDLISLNYCDKNEFYDYVVKQRLETIVQHKYFIYDMDSADSIEIHPKNIKEDVRKNRRDKSHVEEECLSIKALPNIRKQISILEELEHKSGLKEDKLKDDMDNLLALLEMQSKNNLIISLQNTYKIELEFGIATKYLFVHKGRKWNLAITNDRQSTDITVYIDSYKWGAVQRGIYSTEDLLNCHLRIKREGKFSKEEELFWLAFGQLYPHRKKEFVDAYQTTST